MREKENLTLLGNQQNNYETDYNPDLLETFVNKHPENDYFVKFNCPEFTSLCPITGQPDFANIIISYVPGERMVESKSFKACTCFLSVIMANFSRGLRERDYEGFD